MLKIKHEENNFILVYPEATTDPSTGSISWIDKATNGAPRDETNFIDAIINLISRDYSVDSDRIYACGYSEGGIFSYELACRLNNKIAGIASVSGSMLSESERSNLGFSSCSPQHPTAIMLIPGTDDTNAHSLYQGCCLGWNLDSYYLSANEITEYWTNFNSTDNNPSVSDVTNTSTLDGSTIQRKIWLNGDGGVEVQELKVIGGAHDWPGTSGNMDIEANNEIWQFLSKFDKNGVQFVINPNDEFGLTRAIWFKEKNNATVDVINVGMQETESTLRKALAIGADKAIRINIEPNDSSVVAKSIADFVKENNYDLIIAGRESIDYNGGMVPGMISELTNINFIDKCIELNISGNSVEASREIDGGKENISTSLPLIIGGQKGLVEENDLRIPNMRGIMMARKKELMVIEANKYSETLQTNSFEKPKAKGEVTLVSSDEVEKLVELLHNEAKAL